MQSKWPHVQELLGAGVLEENGSLIYFKFILKRTNQLYFHVVLSHFSQIDHSACNFNLFVINWILKTKTVKNLKRKVH